jgi:hypothetical protein
MARQKSILLFGEGKTEAVFLNHLRSLYADSCGTRVLVDAGQGGGPRQVAERMIKKHLDLASYDRSLLLLDADVPSHDIPATWLRKHRILVVVSSPMCLEGMFLTMLEDPPPAKERQLSRNWKRRFQRNHLGTDRDSEILDRLRKKCPELFPRSLVDAKKDHIPALREVVGFLIT